VKILNLDLIAYGPFTAKSLDLRHATANLHILYGPNEAGKSCTLRALSNALYGIPPHTTDAFLHPSEDLRIGLTLDSPHGEFAVVRRKGRANSLRRNDASESIFPPAEWAALLPVEERELFETMFGVDHAEIANGGKSLLSSGSDLGAMLFAAAGGVERLRAVQVALQESADDLYSKRGSRPAINKAMSALKDSLATVKNSMLLVNEYKGLRDAIADTDAQSHKLENEISQASLEQQRLRRLQQASPLMAKRRQRIEQLKPHEATRTLARDFEDRYRKAHDNPMAVEAESKSLTRDIESLKGRIDTTPVAQAILERESEIDLLYQQSGAVKKGADDRVRRQQTLDDTRVDAVALLKSIGGEILVEQAAELRVSDPIQKRILTLGKSKEAKELAVTSITHDLEKVRAEQSRTIAERVGLPAAVDTSALDKALALLPPGRDLEAEHSSLSKVVAAAESELVRAVSALPDWHGTRDELASAAAPLPETVSEFQAAFLQHEADEKGLLSNRTKLKNERDHVERDLRRIEQEQEVPTEHDLGSSRTSRDSQWRSIRQAWLEVIAVDGPALASSFETCVVTSDQIADRLRREAARVSEKAALLVRREQLAEQSAASDLEINAEQRATAELQLEWESRWSKVGVSPRTPTEMQSWLLKRDAIVKQLAVVQQSQAALASLQEMVVAIRQALIPKLEVITGVVVDQATPLSSLTAQARHAVAGQVELRQRKAALQADEQKAVRVIEDLGERLKTANSALSDWKQDWREATADLPVRPDASPEEVEAALDLIRSLMTKIDEMEKLKDRITKLARDEADFTAKVVGAVEAAGLALQPASPFTAIQTLNAELQKNRTNRDLLRTLLGQVETKENDLRHSQDQIARCHALLADLCTEAGAADPVTLPTLIERAADKLAITTALAELEDSLLGFAAGATLEQLAVELEALNPDELPSRIDGLHKQTATLQTKKATSHQSLGAFRQQLKEKETADSAGQSADDVEHLRSRIANLTEEYLRFRLAARILAKAVDRYRENNQGPLLKTAAPLFRQLTGESFHDLQVDWNEKSEAVLMGIRGTNQKHIGVDGMSEATLDQLFLALRLAFVSNYCDSKGPVPFIADDVLMTFDDARATAALQALETLSHHTQVLLFTHHHHHLELARQGLTPDAYRIHHLN